VTQPSLDPIFDIAMSGYSAVYTSMLGTYYSDDTNGSYTFHPSIKPALGSSIEALLWGSNDGYAVIGPSFEVEEGNGVWMSSDAGKNFAFTNISVLFTQARFGAFPSATTWYVAAGAFPNVTQDGYVTNGGVKVPAKISPLKAQIAKTTNGGKTWTSVFYSEREFIFNQISCGSPTSCVVVADSEDYDSTRSGVSILTTKDGGASWNTTFYYNNAGISMSLSAVQFVSPTEVWAAGSYNFYHSTDAGFTWDLVFTPWIVYESSDLSFLSPTVGYAVGADFELGEGAFMTWLPSKAQSSPDTQLTLVDSR